MNHRMNPSPRIHRGLFALLLMAASCAPVRFVSQYDEATDSGVTALHDKIAALLDHLQASESPVSYVSVSARYDDLQRDLRALALRNTARDKNDLTNQQLEQLRQTLEEFEQQHRKRGAMSREAVGPARDAIDTIVRAILKLELAKR